MQKPIDDLPSILRSFSFFRKVLARYQSEDFLSELCKAVDLLSVPSGQILVELGEKKETFFGVVEGRLKVCLPENNESSPSRLRGKGDSIGEADTEFEISGKPSEYRVVAFGDCVLLKIERKTFKKILCKAHLSIH
jgi:CRP-like cAMP-binding protein